nr:hypothetical protein [Nannocystis sp.]
MHDRGARQDLLDLRLDLVGAADDDDHGDLVHVLAGHRLDVRDLDLADLVAVGLPVVLREAEGEDRADAAGDLVGGLDAEGEAADGLGEDLVVLLLGRLLVAHLLDVAEQGGEHLAGGLGLGLGPDGPGAGGLAGLHLRVDAVGEALLLADVEEEATGRAAAQDPRGHVEADPVGVLAGEGEVADADLGLGRAGAVDQVDDQLGRQLVVLEAVERVDRGLALDRLPLAEDALDQRLRLAGGDVAGEDQVGVVRPVEAAVELLERVDVDAVDLGIGRHGPAVGVTRGVGGHAEQGVGEAVGVGLHRLEGGLGLVLELGQRGVGEGRVDHLVGHQGERQLGVLLHDLGEDVGVVHASAGAEAAADELDLLVDLGLGPRLGALAEHLRGHLGQLLVVHGAGADDQLGGDERDLMVLDDVDVDAVLGRELLQVGELHRARLGGGGRVLVDALGRLDDGRRDDDGGRLGRLGGRLLLAGDQGERGGEQDGDAMGGVMTGQHVRSVSLALSRGPSCSPCRRRA